MRRIVSSIALLKVRGHTACVPAVQQQRMCSLLLTTAAALSLKHANRALTAYSSIIDEEDSVQAQLACCSQVRRLP
jgi:hypothetical protein